MLTKPSSRDLRRVLRAAAPPLLTLGTLLAVGEVSYLDAWSETVETSRLVATFVAGTWLAVTTAMTGYRTRSDAYAHRRLQELRDAAQTPGRVLVHVEAVVWRSRAGQHAVVVNVATGYRYHLWFPEADLPDGAFALLERAGNGARVVDLLGAQVIEAAHHYERYARATRAVVAEDPLHRAVPRQHDSVDTLVHEVEEYLKTQGP